MRLHLFSDLHLEFGPVSFPKEVTSGELAELVLLAGDIHVRRRAIRWAATTFSQRTAMIGGNHESYQDSLFAMIAESRRQAIAATKLRAEPIRYLERETWDFVANDGVPVRILGATLWTDFELFGPEARLKSMAHAQEHLNDFLYVKVRETAAQDKRRLNPADTIFFHRRTIEFLAGELRQPFDGITVVMTHHSPSPRSLPAADRNDPLSACYASALDSFIEAFQPNLWVHGHIHISNDYRIGQTRVVSNPRGYAEGHSNPDFDPALVIEV